MERIEFVDLKGELEKKNIRWYPPSCCNPVAESYAILRVQMQGQFSFDRYGVRVESPEHDEKCLSLLRMAVQKRCDLVLFPEYCISYPVLEKMICDSRLRPENRKLWVLPCQGISVDDFNAFMNQAAGMQGVFVLDKAWTSPKVTKNSFVTALFYCFIGYQDEEPVLCLVPQLKAQPMGDHNCLCEQAGMSTGGVIYTLENRLLTLLCADSMNNGITWQEFQETGLLMSGLIILHPQLNPKPKDNVFSRLRWELFQHGQPGAYITCNWAKGTELYQKGTPGKAVKSIDLSWSCIYRKHTDDIYNKWRENDGLRQRNAKCGLWGAFMPAQRTEVWFSLNQEEALELKIPNLSSDSYAKIQISDVFAQTRFIYNKDAKTWDEQEAVSKTLQQRIDAVCSEGDCLSEYSRHIQEPYRFPLDTPDKFDSDQFLALALAETQEYILEVDAQENLSAWSFLLDEPEKMAGAKSLGRLLDLIEILENHLPSHCASLREERSFCYQPGQGIKPSVNIHAKDGEALVAITETPMDAQSYVKSLKSSECHDDEDLLRQFVRIFYHDPIRQKWACEPQVSTEITEGDAILMKGDITYGGKESDS